MSNIDYEKIAVGVADVFGALRKTAKDLYRGGRDLIREVRYDTEAFRQRDPAATSNTEILLLYSGLHARTAHRLSHKLYKKGHTFTARLVSQGAKFVTGIEIHPGATIGRGLVIDHGAGVVIGETAEIGDNCTIYQGVTLGGTGKNVGKRHPTLGNNVMIGAGAKVLGPLTIGDNAKIAAGAVALHDVPADSTAVGIPARVVSVGGVRIANDLDQIHIPDPIKEELNLLRAESEKLRRRILKLEKAAAGTEEKTTKSEQTKE